MAFVDSLNTAKIISSSYSTNNNSNLGVIKELALGRQEFLSLDGMRGVAAFAVVAIHVELILHGTARYFPSAYLAVDLFFILSGFVLEYAYGSRLASSMGPRKFIISRYIRLYPLFLIGVIFGSLNDVVALVFGGGALSVGGLASAITTAAVMLPSPTWRDTTLLFPVNVPGWSLIFELLVNLAFAAFFRRLSTPIIAGIITVSAVVLVASVFSGGNIDFGSTWNTALPAFPRVFFSFFTGVVLCRLHGSIRLDHAACLIVPFIMIPISILSPSTFFRPFYDLLTVVFLFPAMVFVAASYQPLGSVAVLFRVLGLISFPLYAIHFPILEILHRALRLTHHESYFAPAAFIVCLILIPVSLLLVRFYDEPARRRLLSFAKPLLKIS